MKAHQADAENADEHVFEALADLTTDGPEDAPPKPSEEVYRNVQEQPTYSKMMAALVDQVKNEVDKSKETNRHQAYVKEIGQHKSKVQELQGKLLEELAKLEKEASRHITSDDLHTGFDSSHVRSNALRHYSSLAHDHRSAKIPKAWINNQPKALMCRALWSC